MAGFLNFAIPAGQTLGPALEAQGLQNQLLQQKQVRESAFDKMLSGLGPEYHWAQEARKAGASMADVSSWIGGAEGASMKEAFRTHRLHEIFSAPGAEKNPALYAQAIQEGLYQPSEAKEAWAIQQGPEPKTEFEHYVKDVIGMSLDDYGKLPDEGRKSIYEGFLGEKLKFSATMEKPQIQFKSVWNKKTKRNELVALDPREYVGGQIVGEPAKSRGEVAAIKGVDASRALLGGLKSMLENTRQQTGAVRAHLQSWAYKAGFANKRADLLSQIGNSIQQLSTAAMSANNTRAFAYLQSISDHFPKYGDSDALLLDKIEMFTKKGGFLDVFENMVGDESDTGAPAEDDESEAIRELLEGSRRK